MIFSRGSVSASLLATETAGRRLRWVLLGLLLLGFSVPSAAQQRSLSGTVRDADGVVSDATVTLRASGAAPLETKTDGVGGYSFGGLANGFYELSVYKAGYETVTHSLTLSENSEPVNVTLAVGGVSTSITVVDAAGKATASRMDVLDRDLPVQVSSIPQQVLQQQGINDVATALRNVRGFRRRCCMESMSSTRSEASMLRTSYWSMGYEQRPPTTVSIPRRTTWKAWRC